MTTSYDLLRDKCNELLPERLELKFGCHLLYKGLGYFYLRRNDNHGHWLLRAPVTCFRTVSPVGDEWVKNLESSFTRILGPELTITDVLRALHRAYPLNDYYVTTNGTLYKQSSKMLAGFFLSAPLSDPSNAPACEAVLKLLDSKKV